MNLLEKNQQQHIRLKAGDFEVYNPNLEQKEIIANLISEDIKLNENLDATGTIDSSVVRFLFSELTNIGDEIESYSDSELVMLIDNGNKDLKLVYREISEIASEVIEELQYTQYVKIANISKTLDVLKDAQMLGSAKDKLEDMLKAAGVEMSVDEFIEASTTDKDVENNNE